MFKLFRLNESNLKTKSLLNNFIWKNYLCTVISESTNLDKQQQTQQTTEPNNAENNKKSILVEKDDCITLIGINRPKQRNSINKECAERLTNALSDFENDDTSPVAVLYGVGGNFCAGYDPQELKQQIEHGSMDFITRHEGAVGPTRRQLRKPVVCAITGYCVASGLELALSCDMRVMEESALLGFANRCFGVPLHDGGTVRLAAMIGYSRALELLLTGRSITAKEALHLGLINRFVATGAALGQSVNLAFSIAKFSQATLQQDRHNLFMNTYKRHGFRHAVQNEMMNMSTDVINEMVKGVHHYKEHNVSYNSGECKVDSWLVTRKPIPDWEKAEIELEKKYLETLKKA